MWSTVATDLSSGHGLFCSSSMLQHVASFLVGPALLRIAPRALLKEECLQRAAGILDLHTRLKPNLNPTILPTTPP